MCMFTRKRDGKKIIEKTEEKFNDSFGNCNVEHNFITHPTKQYGFSLSYIHTFTSKYCLRFELCVQAAYELCAHPSKIQNLKLTFILLSFDAISVLRLFLCCVFLPLVLSVFLPHSFHLLPVFSSSRSVSDSFTLSIFLSV